MTAATVDVFLKLSLQLELQAELFKVRLRKMAHTPHDSVSLSVALITVQLVTFANASTLGLSESEHSVAFTNLSRKFKDSWYRNIKIYCPENEAFHFENLQRNQIIRFQYL